MELDDLRSDWESLNKSSFNKNKLTPEKIQHMTQLKYKAIVNKINYPEWIGSLVCLLAVAFIVFQFHKLDTIFMQVLGVITVLLLIVMPALSIISLRKINFERDLGQPHATVLREFLSQKVQFHKLRRINMLCSHLLLVTTFMIFPVLFGGADIFHQKYSPVIIIPLAYIYLVFITKWVKKYYNKTLLQAESALKELENA